MPIYSYRCEHCGHRQDVLQKMSDSLLTVCPACGQPAFKKQVTAAGFQLKGSGWYVTDFRSPPAPAGAKKTDESAAPASDAAASKTEDGKVDAKPSSDTAPTTAPPAATAATTKPVPAPKPTPSASTD
jgi:putative FmdB family regulatory protein